MDNNSPSPTISIKPKDSTIDSKFGVVVTTPNYLQFFSDIPSYYQFLKDPKNYKDLLLGTVNIGNLIRNSLSNPEFKQFVQDIVLDIEIPPSIDIDTIVTIEGEQEVKGRKDFTGGLAVNGQNLIYDPVKKVWQLTGDLVVTGAVTMFGSLSGFTPSTVMDAVLVDGVTIVKDEQGRLTVIGGGGGTEGGLTSDEVNILIANALSPINKSLSTKWTQDDTKIANWDSAFKWGDHSKAGYMKSTDFNTQLKQYILKDTVEQISARHNFTDGLQIDGINIYKSQDKTIYLDANLVVSGAFAMFGNNSTTFETIWKDIPFDLNTMEWTGSEWRVIGGANNIDVTTVNSLIYEYLNRTGEEYAKQSWVNQQGFAKQSALTAVDNRLMAVEVFFATEDSDTLVNKWAEIVEFLNATEGDTLDNILKTKANQSALDAAVTSLTTEIGKKWTQDNSKIANWDSAYGWGNHANAGYAAKTYVDGELAKYILKDTAQTISARHNFSDGLKIGGLGITKSQDDVIYVDANLVVRGAVTMFGSGATIASSIWASIPFDLNTMEWTGSEWTVVSGGSGSVNEATVNNLIYEYLTKNSYAKISDISSALTGYATQTWVEGKKYLTGITSSMVTTALGYTPYNSANFTKANIKSTLVISDWALAATKPSYTAAEVGALSTSGGVISSLTIGRGTNGYETLLLNTSTGVGFLIYEGGVNWKVSDANWSNSYSIIHSGNIGQQSVNYAASAGVTDSVSVTPVTESGGYSLALLTSSSTRTQSVCVSNNQKALFNPSTGALTATSFIGNLTGNADSANEAYRFRTIVSVVNQLIDLNTECLGGGLVRNYAGPSYWRNAPDGLAYGMVLTFASGFSSTLQGQLAWDVNHASTVDTTRNLWWRANDQTDFANSKWHQIAFADSNVASATKLQTARTIWGQSFDGTGNVSGLLTDVDGIRGSTTNGGYIGDRNKGLGATDGGSMIYNYSSSPITFHIAGFEHMRITNGGNVAIGGTTADAKLHVHGDAKIGGVLNITSNNTTAIVLTDSSRQESSIAFKGTGGNEWYVGKGVGNINDFFGIYNAYKGNALVIDNNSDVTIYGNLLTTGAITMFSQLSMKNVIDYDGLSLAQLAQIKPARFTWKDRRDNRIHVGGIADYIQPILPEVVYETVNKELTVDYGSAAFYIGTSLIKPVVELWEVKDKQQQEIESLKKRVEYLENENRQLRAS